MLLVVHSRSQDPLIFFHVSWSKSGFQFGCIPIGNQRHQYV
jgi:hypothetical protein